MDRVALIFAPVRRFAEYAVALLLFSMFVGFILQVVYRYILEWPVAWTIEYVTVAWLWGILFGYAFVVRDIDIVRFDLFYLACPAPARRLMTAISGLAVAGIFLWALPADIGFVRFMGIEKTAAMKIPFDLLFAVYIPFSLAVIGRALYEVWLAATNRVRDPAEAFEPESESHV